MQESLRLRATRAAAYGSIITPGSTLKIFSGTPPFGCDAADPAGLLATIPLPSPAFGVNGGAAVQIGVWQTDSVASGYAGCYRINDAAGACHVQGYVSEPWAPSSVYGLGRQVSTPAGIYLCTQAGECLSGGAGPIAMGDNIQDGGVLWSYLAAMSEMVLPSTAFMAGQSLVITGFSIMAGNQ
jgi:hypothetical protein